MLKFFRRFRQKLIDEGNLKRYLLYAIGEIILVVIGILFALQLNTLNQNRINDKEENRILHDLSVELQYYLFLQEKGSAIMHTALEGGQLLLDDINKPKEEIDKAQVDINIHRLTLQWMSGRNTTLYDVLSGSGDFDLIKSSELRAKLGDLKANQETLLLFEELQFRFVAQELKPFLNRHVDRTVVRSNFESADLNISHHTSSFSTSHEELLSNMEFANLLTDLIFTTKNLTNTYGRIQKDIMQIDSLIGLKDPSLRAQPYVPY